MMNRGKAGKIPVSEFAPEECLNMCVEGLGDLELREAVLNMQHLKKLELNVNQLTSLNALASLTSLRFLSISDNALKGVRELVNCHALETLFVDINSLTDLKGLEELDSLVYLKASSNSITNFPTLLCKKLEKLELYHNHISYVPEKSMAALTSLVHLDLGRNRSNLEPQTTSL